MADFNHRFSIWVSVATPAFLTLLFITLSAVDFNIPGIESFVPKVALIGIFYWAIYCPNLMPAWVVFLIGIFEDFIYGTPFGISSFINLLFWWIVTTQRKYFFRESFWVVWGVFGFVMLLFSLASYVVYSLYFGELFLSNELLMQWILSSLMYPFFHKLFSSIHVSLLKG